jgi:hypothetical protein
MHMQALLTLVMVLAIIRAGVVMVVMVVPMIVVVMVAMMNMVSITMLVGVSNETRECAGWYRKGHADSGCQGKHNSRRPDKCNAASACSLCTRQHVL